MYMQFATTLLLALGISIPAAGSVTIYTSKTNWQNAVGDYSTIDFTGFPPSGTWLNEQYAYLGMHFTDGSDQFYNNANLFNDGWGLNGAFDDSTLEFDVPITTIAMDYPGHVQMNLYSNGQLIYNSPSIGLPGVGNFAGLISTKPFDKVVLHDGGLFIDNIYFGPPVPTPGVLAAFALSALVARRNRRRR